MKTEAEVLQLYEREVNAWAWMLAQRNSMYDAAFHRVWALADVLDLDAKRITADMKAAQDQIETTT